MQIIVNNKVNLVLIQKVGTIYCLQARKAAAIEHKMIENTLRNAYANYEIYLSKPNRPYVTLTNVSLNCWY